MAQFKELIDRNPTVVFLSFIITAFGAGYWWYGETLRTAKLEAVPKDSYVLKADLIGGKFVAVKVLREINYLIDVGQNLGEDQDKALNWLSRTVTFVHEVGLAKDSLWEGQQVSSVERDMRLASTDSSVESRVQKTLGILQGFQAALSVGDLH